MTHIDNSQNMSVEQVKEHLTNLINKQAKKVASEGNYDRTILATIQYCSNAVLGQYKIKYQNGYYSAYALDTSSRYNDGAAVYVTVPGNDLSNRLFIQGLATDDSTQKTYLTNLEGDQQYVTTGPNLIDTIYYGDGNDCLSLSSYWDMTPGREVMYYNYDWVSDPHQNPNNKITLINIGEMTHAIREGDGFIRFGADFKTNLPDNRKQQGDYGIRLVLVFDKVDSITQERTEYTETYELNTFNMDGTPFEFNEFAQRYEYFEIDKENFKRVQSISAYVKGFPQAEQSDPNYRDIFIRNITFHSALKVYDETSDDYVVKVLTPGGTLFGLDESVDSLPFEALFTVRGNEVADSQNVQYFWAKKNVNIKSVGDPKYINYFGAGWQCINQSEVTSTDKSTLTEDDLNNYIIDSTDYPAGYVGVLHWISAKNIGIPKSLCAGRETIIKCCVVYQNQVYFSREYTITNYNGYYLMLTSTNGTEFFSGKGYTSIVAGVFRTEVTGSGDAATYKPVPQPYSISSNVVYKWEIVNNGVTINLPTTTSSIIYKSQPDWRYDETIDIYQDNVETTVEESNHYLHDLSIRTGINQTLLECCIERFNYYNTWINNYTGDTTASSYVNSVAKRNAIVNDWKGFLDDQFNQSFNNELGLYVLGSSNVTAKYNDYTTEQLKYFYDNQIDPLEAKSNPVEIDTITYNYGTQPFDESEQNTLYNFRVGDIVQQATIRVTALYKNGNSYESLETREIYLNNNEGTGLKYNLEIVNGSNTFQYDAGGLAPKMTIRPLSYRLYGQDGSLIFDSAADDSNIVVTNTKPKWSFYRASSLITTKYSEDLTNEYLVDPDIPGKVSVLDRAKFDFNIAEEYNVNYKERSNIELTITYQGTRYNASTNFTFTKQGELGTNGTNMVLDIEDPVYEQYRSDILTDKMYSRMTDGFDSPVSLSPNERHLKNTYLYATRVYNDDGEGNPQEALNFDEGTFCNLRFAHGVTENDEYTPDKPRHFDVFGSVTTTLYGYWYENGTHSLIGADSSSKWQLTDTGLQTVQSQHLPGRSPIFDRPSFGINPTQGQSTILTLTPPTNFAEDAAIFYKPMDVIYTQNNIDYQWTANNVVHCSASHEIAEQLDPVTTKPIIRRNHGYYQIPFFFYSHYTNQNGVYINDTPEGLDPARHFVITGGYDEIIYGADGLNPQYNKQDPFTLNIFDTEGNDITQQVFDSNNVIVTWNTSYGFTYEPIVVGSVSPYSTLTRGKSLFNTYCTYNGRKYKCIVPHTPDQYVAIRDEETNEVIKEYNKDPIGDNDFDFITPYWEEVTNNYFRRTQKVTPPPSYEACAVNSLFNSWVSVKVVYDTGAEKIETAALLPINILCNPYGSDEINGWDGKKTIVDDGYIISNKVAAGVKDDDDKFTGITIGQKMITNGTADKTEVGLFGYGRYTDSNIGGNVGWGQTIFLDANTGLAAFGPRGSTQIILNPKVPAENTIEESWSRLAGWYFSSNYLYKPLWADDNYLSTAESSSNSDYYNTNPPDADGVVIPGSIGFYVPSSKKAGQLTKDTVFMWASAAGVTSSSFDDDGKLTVLQELVRSIKTLMQSENFPLVYHTKAVSTPIIPDIVTDSTISNLTMLSDVYANDVTVMTALNQYTQTWLDMIDAIQQDEEGRYLYETIVDQISSINDIFNTNNFPLVTRDGVVVRPIVSDGITIENYQDLFKWYSNSNEPAITYRSDLIEDLTVALQGYQRNYYQLVHYMYDTLSDYVLLIAQKLQAVETAITTVGVRSKSISTWDIDNPYAFIYNADKVTIDNFNTISLYYIRHAYTASEIAIEKLELLNDKFTDYLSLHNEYEEWKTSYEGQGTAISYTDTNTKKMNSNFYITYGGKMKCNNAEVAGKITAKSGVIGEGSGAVQIATYHYDNITQRNQYYLLYNPVFRVKGDDPATQTSASVYIDGTIMARSGQIGKVGEDKDGYSSKTLFIQYTWYPWDLPEDNEPWGSSINTKESAGKSTLYTLYHKNFYIDNSGNAVLQGRIYSRKGRLGDWVVTTNELKDIYEHIVLKPSNDPNPNNARASQIKLGKNANGWNLTLYGDGSITGQNWSIDADGESHFTNPNNTVVCSEATIGGATLTGSDWNLPAGTKLNWGGCTLAIEGGGFNFTGGASFKDECFFEDKINVSDQVEVGGSGGAIISSSHIYFGGQGGGYGFTSSGAAKFGATELNGALNMSNNNITSCNTITANTAHISSIYVGNQTLEAYIQSIVGSMTISGSTSSQVGEGTDHYHTFSV